MIKRYEGDDLYKTIETDDNILTAMITDTIAEYARKYLNIDDMLTTEPIGLSVEVFNFVGEAVTSVRIWEKKR